LLITSVAVTDTRDLVDRSVGTWGWQQRGACRGLNSESFFHPDGERGTARSRREARAKAICRYCPVMTQCRGYALAGREPYGVWGGLSRVDRDRILGRLPAAQTP
jgi:WhiB family redox-sensing transcriptional regulator